MSEQELPEVGSVWRHNETGEVRVIVPGDGNDSDNVVYFLKAGSETLHCAKLEYWKAWEPHFTRLSPAPPVDVAALEPAEVFDWKQALAGVEVFGPWQRYDWPGMLHCWKRKLPARDDGAFSWLGVDGNYLFSIPPFGGDRGMGSPKEGFPTLSAAQAACDAVLRKAGVLLVD